MVPMNAEPQALPRHPLHRPVLDWYAEHARDLPWRRPEATPWAVMVSEFMLQQTPVVRVLPVFESWMSIWPTPGALAAATSGDAVRAWGRLGYPRRALRLHAAATAIVDRHGGAVPANREELLALPGVGDYTASAIASFAFGARHAVLDTNVRRVLARAVGGEEFPARSVTRTERDWAEALVPHEEAQEDAATWAVAVMELGALVCTAANPRCEACPINKLCVWNIAGRPAYDGPPRRGQAWAGTDRQVRGRLMAVLRDAEGSVARARLDGVWPDDVQRDRALASLLHDGLVIETDIDGGAGGGPGYSLPN
jgi:A/G-specific adenine glycosylase